MPSSASGLGRATVLELHSHGGYVAILDLNEDAGTEFVKELGSERALFQQADIADTESVAKAVEAVVSWTKKTGKSIGGVVAAAGVGNPGKIIDRHNNPVSLSSFDFVININLRGTVDLIRQVLPTMTQNTPTKGDGERGVLIMVSSVAAFDGQPGQLAYSASKGAVASMTLPLARDLAPYGIRAVTIAPGVFASNMTSLMADKVKKSLERVMEFPKRMGRGDEFAHLVRQTIENAMLNATVIRLDGGIRMPSKM